MSGFSIPGIMPSAILRGATDRLHEYEKRGFEDAQTRRREIIDFYANALDRLAPEPSYDPVRNEIMGEVAKVSNMEPEKVRKYKVKADYAAPQHLLTPTAEEPKIDLSHVHQIVGQISAAQAAQAGQSWQNQPNQPQMPQSPAVGPAGSTAMTPGEATAPMPPMAATPPGRSAPEASPLVGSIPGMTPPMMMMQPPQSAAGQPPAPAPAATGSPSVTPTTADGSLSPFPHKLSPRYGAMKGASEAAEFLPRAQTAQAMGLTIQGKPLLSARDVAYAAKAGYVFERDPQTGQLAQRRMRPDEMSMAQEQQLELNALKATYTQHRQQLIAAQTELVLMSAKMKPAELKIKEGQLSVAWARVAAEQQNLSLKLKVFESNIIRDPASGQVMSPKIAALLMPPALSRGRADLARASQQKVDEVIGLVEDAANQVGPFSGTVNELLLKYGLSNSDVAQLDMAMDNVSAMQPGIHGIRSAQMADRFKQKLTLNQPAENLVAMLQELQTTADAVIKVGGDTKPLMPHSEGAGAGDEVRPGGGDAKRLSKTQTNPKTGAKRTVYSVDGGKTWHP